MRGHLLQIAILLSLSLQAGGNSGGGHLLVSSYGLLLALQPDGRQAVLADSANSASLSPDGKRVAYTTSGDEQSLMVVNVDGTARTELVKLPKGAHFGEIGWTPDGGSVAYESAVPNKGTDLYLAAFPPMGAAPRNLGHSYQGFSFSPDGAQIVHAVNGADSSGLEVLDLRTGKRTLIHKTKTIVWDAQFSPDSRFIAYSMTLSEPDRQDDEPDCTPPTIGLWIYSLADHSEHPVVIRDAPKEWENVKNFAWSPDSKRIALTLGTVDCDYPGSAVSIFVTTVDLKSQTRLSKSEMAFEPAFAPDGSGVAFVDFSDSPAKLMHYDLATGKLRIIRIASEQNNYYHLIGWR